MNELFSWPFFWSVVVVCITVHSLVRSHQKNEIAKEMIKSGKDEYLDYLEHM